VSLLKTGKADNSGVESEVEERRWLSKNSTSLYRGLAEWLKW
jgi:hypothetical protein